MLWNAQNEMLITEIRSCSFVIVGKKLRNNIAINSVSEKLSKFNTTYSHCLFVYLSITFACID